MTVVEGVDATAAASLRLAAARLLREAAESAEFLGARTLRARATELERGYPFGVALQLFEEWGESGFTPHDRRADELGTVFDQLVQMAKVLEPLRS